MFEKVNPSHPDKIADRIAGAIVDLAYKKDNTPKIAVEVLIGHNKCNIIIESNLKFAKKDIQKIVNRIGEVKDIKLNLLQVQQDKELAKNQEKTIKCGDNGIFCGCEINDEEQKLVNEVKNQYQHTPKDGKYIYDSSTKRIIVCQSNITEKEYMKYTQFKNYDIVFNPLGFWTGGINVDTGATNRKLGSDMGRAVTGGGLHGKDLSKADVSVNIYCHIQAQKYKQDVKAYCAIGDENVRMYLNNKWYIVPYKDIIEIARNYVKNIGGFEKLAEWGLIR